MLVPTVLFFSAACSLLIAYGVLSGRGKRQNLLIAEDVRGEIDSKVKEARELDDLLARRLAEGRSLGAAIGDWQAARAGILSTGKTNRPWCWSAEDLQAWAKQRLSAAAAEISRTTGITLLVLSVTVVAMAVLGSLGYYHFYAQRGVFSRGNAMEATADEWARSDPLSAQLPSSVDGATTP